MMQNPRPASSSSSAASVSTSSEVLIRELSAQTAPLWRNAPGVRHSSPGPPKVAQPIRNSPGTVTPLVSFQKSLRSYPSPSGGSTSSVNSSRNVQRVSSTGAAPSVPITHNYITNLDLEQTSPFFLDYLDSQAALSAGGVGTGAGLLNQTPAASGPNAFDHRKFMNMFQTDPRLMQGDLGSTSAAAINQNADSQSIQSSMDSVAAITAPPLAQSVQIVANNNRRTKNLQESEDLKNNNNNNNNSGCASNLNQKPLLRTQKQTDNNNSVVLRRPRRPSTMDERNSNSNNVNQRLQSAAERRSQIEDARRERLLRQLDFSSRIGLGGGPAAGAANQYQQSSQQFQQQSSSQNPSVAFGSTRPRNIDLTRPLVTPWSQNSRPKSEIYSGSIFGSDSVNVAYSKDDSNYRTAQRVTAARPVTTCYVPSMTASMNASWNNSQPASFQQQQPAPARLPAVQSQCGPVRQSSSSDDSPASFGSISIAPIPNLHRSCQMNNSQQQQQQLPTIRAVRRHDPELVPALQKYNFRDYTGPGSGVSSSNSSSGLGGFGALGFGGNNPRTSNSMVNSITSVKSFNNGGGGGNNRYLPLNQQARPKKSYSMNRLDQLAQPRRRPEPVSKEQKVLNRYSQISTPTSREMSTSTSAKRISTTPTSGSSAPTYAFQSDKPVSQSARSKPRVQPKPSTVAPSPKTPSGVPNVNEGRSVGRPSTAASGSSAAPKPRPLSHYEPLVDHNSNSSSRAGSEPQSTNQSLESPHNNNNKSQTTSASGSPAATGVDAASAAPANSEEADKLAEYKRALAEKRAQYRKYQQELEQNNKNNVRNGGGRGKATIVRVNPLSDSLEQELQQSKKQSSTMSTSSSSSSSSDDDESQRPTTKNGPNSAKLQSNVDHNSGEDAKLASKDKLSLSTKEHSPITDSELMQQSDLLTGDDQDDLRQMEPIPANVLMTTSCDASLLAAATSSNNNSDSDISGNGPTTPSSGASNPRTLAASTVLSKQELEQRNEMLKKHEMERQKRKSRVQEILKRTIGTPEGGSTTTTTPNSKSSETGVSKDSTATANNNDNLANNDNMNEDNSSSSSNNTNNSNGNDDHHNINNKGDQMARPKHDDLDNNQCDNNSISNLTMKEDNNLTLSLGGVASVNSGTTGTGTAAGTGSKDQLLSAHSNGNGNLHLDMKTYCAENDQSLPPTNGF